MSLRLVSQFFGMPTHLYIAAYIKSMIAVSLTRNLLQTHAYLATIYIPAIVAA